MAEMACYTVLFEQIRNMIPKQVNHTLFKFQNESSTSPESLNWNIVFGKWQDHVYDFETMIWNHVSDSGKSNAPLDMGYSQQYMHVANSNTDRNNG